MPTRAKLPFRADHVGSLLRPPELLQGRRQFASGEISAAQLQVIENDAIRIAVKMQEAVGLPVVTDGEFRRTFWHLDFLTSFAHAERVAPKVKARFHTHSGDLELEAPGIRVTGKLSRPAPIFLDGFRFLKSIAKSVPKVTIPSPTIMHFRGGRAAIDSVAYPDLEEFFSDLGNVYAEEIEDLGEAGCTYLQIDETNLAYLCDPALREQVRVNIGTDPDQLANVYARLINAAIASRPPDMRVMVHLCRGNFCSGWAAEGGYEPVANTLFNQINADGYFLEYDDERSGSFEPLRWLPKGKIAVLGLITTKGGQLESKDVIKRRIDEAARYAPFEQLALSPQCGFASTVEGNSLTIDDQQRKLALLVEVADEVWGR